MVDSTLEILGSWFDLFESCLFHLDHLVFLFTEYILFLSAIFLDCIPPFRVLFQYSTTTNHNQQR